MVDLLNAYGPSIAILFVVFVEAAGVCWLYGVERFSDDIRKMTGFRPGIFWRTCWNFISPVFIFVSLQLNITTSKMVLLKFLLLGFAVHIHNDVVEPRAADEGLLRLP